MVMGDKVQSYGPVGIKAEFVFCVKSIITGMAEQLCNIRQAIVWEMRDEVAEQEIGGPGSNLQPAGGRERVLIFA